MSSKTAGRSTREYDKNEPCLCFHGPYLYEAKILDFRQEEPGVRKSPFEYRVHYKGWKNTWDDWVPEDRLRKPTDENKELAANLYKELLNQQRELRDQKAAAKKGGAASAKRKSEGGAGALGGNYRTSEERSSSVQAPVRGTKRGREWDIEKEEAFTSKPSIKIPLPDHLKGILVDDWENVSKNLQLVSLPHEHTVKEILDDYKAHESQSRRPGSPEYDVLEEVVQGLREYFDKSLGRILLYRFERQQWLEISTKVKAESVLGNGSAGDVNDDEASLSGRKPSEIYGAEHLCRLFVSMPELIAQTNMDAPSVNRLREELHKMTKWLGKNSDAYFTKEYIDPGQAYKDAARGGGI